MSFRKKEEKERKLTRVTWNAVLLNYLEIVSARRGGFVKLGGVATMTLPFHTYLCDQKGQTVRLEGLDIAHSGSQMLLSFP